VKRRALSELHDGATKRTVFFVAPLFFPTFLILQKNIRRFMSSPFCLFPILFFFLRAPCCIKGKQAISSSQNFFFVTVFIFVINLYVTSGFAFLCWNVTINKLGESHPVTGRGGP
jgi:hypothetical protein